MRRTVLLVAALFPCTAIAQPADYRISELTQACVRWDMVHASIESAKAKRSVGALSIGCAPLAEGHEVRLIQRKGDVAQVDFCTVDDCLRRWVLMSVLGPEGI
jgi:hypothetical protein